MGPDDQFTYREGISTRNTAYDVLAIWSRGAELTVRVVAERLHVSTATVYSLCRRNELGHHRISHAIRIPEGALAKYLALASTATKPPR